MNTSLRIVGNRTTHNKNDFYPTPSWATRALLDKESFEGSIWECASGNGAISKVLEQDLNNEIISSDISSSDYIYGTKCLDFLKSSKKVDNIITNPPFKSALDFIFQGKRLAQKKIALLLRLNFLESQRRHPMFIDKDFPLKSVNVFSKRISFEAEKEGTKKSGLIAFSWFIWDRDWEGRPIINWIL